jgi:hypothetical protein
MVHGGSRPEAISSLTVVNPPAAPVRSGSKALTTFEKLTDGAEAGFGRNNWQMARLRH